MSSSTVLKALWRSTNIPQEKCPLSCCSHNLPVKLTKARDVEYFLSKTKLQIVNVTIHL